MEAVATGESAVIRVLGIDPGTFNMGVGVVDSEDGKLTRVYSGVLSPGRDSPLAQRLHYLYEQVLETMQEWRPSLVAIEEPFVARNPRSAMAVGQAQAVAMVAAAHCGLTVSSYAPRAVKKAVTDYGGSSKEQVQQMVKVMLGLSEDSWQSSDAADALAVAICHIGAVRVTEIEVE